MERRILYQRLKEYKMYIFLIIALTGIVSLTTAFLPYVNQTMFDEGLTVLDVGVTIKYCIGIFLLLLCNRICEYFENKAEMKMCNQISVKWKEQAFLHGLNLRAAYYKQDSFFQVIRNATYDIDCIMGVFQNYLLKVIVVLMRAVGAAVGLLVLNWKLSCIVILSIPIKYIINTVITKYELRYSIECLETNRQYNLWFNDFISGIVDIKLWGLEQQKLDEFGEILEAQTHTMQKASLLGSKANLAFFTVERLFSYGLYIIGIFLILRGELTIGALISFVSYSSSFFTPIEVLLNAKRMLKKIAPNIESLQTFYQMEEENSPESIALEKPVSNISFNHVSVTLGDRDILSDVCLDLYRGDRVLVLGDNGSGKSTLLNLLLRIYEPTCGKIFFNGEPAEQFEIKSFRRHFSVVNQEVHLFEGTVMDNITVGKRTGLAKHTPAFCDSSIRNLSNQYNTVVGFNGTMLSGGERQKVALLRALNRECDILVLDEPTASYDHESEMEFNAFISSNHTYGFYFVVSHRPELQEFANVILRIENGRVEVIRKEKV